MDKKELAALLNGREYGEEITKEECAAAKKAGLVVCFGASDDLMEFRGAFEEEVGCWRGGEANVDSEGLFPDFDDVPHEVDPLRDWFRREGRAKKIEAVWDEEGYSWIYKTEIPHIGFDIMEDGEKFCRGIVFSIEDL